MQNLPFHFLSTCRDDSFSNVSKMLNESILASQATFSWHSWQTISSGQRQKWRNFHFFTLDTNTDTSISISLPLKMFNLHFLRLHSNYVLHETCLGVPEFM